MPDKEEGRKFDSGKLRFDLIPVEAFQEFVKVLTHGSTKYDAFNWVNVKNGLNRYFAATERHVWSYRSGEQIDPESKIHHLAHAICDLMFLLQKELVTKENWQKYCDMLQEKYTSEF